mmetsp:Transcript_2710/g.7208  ORF Transcript_2710/g.7208 Transcript_2710/m.7208 type:complete len:221 (-) Transcript_2710:445-1107(-)
MGLLQQDTDSRGGLDINSSVRAELVVVPPHVVPVCFEDNIRCDRVPDGLVGEKDGLCGLHLFLSFHSLGNVCDVILSDHLQQSFNVLRRSSQPVLEGHHEGSGIGCLIGRQELQDLWQSAQQLEHSFLERRSIFLLLLLHEIGNYGFRLTKILHCERSDLVESHYFGHGREDEARVKIVASRLDNVYDLLGQFLNEDQRSDENVRVFDIVLELCVGVIVS